MMKQKEKLEKQLDKVQLDEYIARVTAQKAEEDCLAYQIGERTRGPKKMLIERVEELRMAPLWADKSVTVQLTVTFPIPRLMRVVATCQVPHRGRPYRRS
ncbi:hypothetical protein WOLCODRAFT_159075 [Wolfiporia cocos MD-104 SS10]|uniref:Uncharacterized protein n=1 Tax=Wolfiporia cocos (strain MD-104) TaxID=742152 RepID=A0A2H3JC79_WOLCO|nr:hypothetical protein WOLCODRAFT_159075 [Wolfiporia cocos MD-104 SS10]